MTKRAKEFANYYPGPYKGMRAGDLTVLGIRIETPEDKKSLRLTKDGLFQWGLQCRCQRIFDMDTVTLRTTLPSSCGVCPAPNESPRNTEESKRNLLDAVGIFKRYRANARKANRDFDLTINPFIEMILDDCFYCGAAPSTRRITLLYNGVDRIDNTKGYSEKNCVPCCSICNFAKSNMPAPDFVDWMRRIRTNWPRWEARLNEEDYSPDKMSESRLRKSPLVTSDLTS